MKRTFIVIFLFLPFFVDAQNTSLKGKVVDIETTQPLQGAIIFVKDAGNGTVTNQFGIFNLKTYKAPVTLMVSFVGYETQEVIVEGQEFMNISLKPAKMELEQVVISPKGNNSLQTLSQVDVNLRPVNTAQDILRMVPGLFIAQHAGGGKAEQIFLRGFDIDHGTDVAISVDGMPVNMVSHAHGQGYADLHFLMPETVGQIDFGKGTYYASKGNFTTAGYVNFQTKNRLEKNLIKLEGGQYGTFRTVAMMNLLDKKSNLDHQNVQNAYIASEYFVSNGAFESPQNFNRINIFGKYSFQTEKETLQLQASTFSSKWDASGQVPDRAIQSGLIGRFGAIDNTEGGKTHRTNVTANYIKNLSENVKLQNQFFFSKYDFELYSNFTFFLNDPINADQIRQKESRNLLGYKGNIEILNSLKNMELTTNIGGAIRYDATENTELSRTKSRKIQTAALALGNVTETNLSGYIDENIEIGKWLINAGIRGDYFKFEYVDNLDSTYKNQTADAVIFSPKLNFIFNANPRLQLYLKSGKSFHSNDSRVSVVQKGRDVLPPAYGSDLGIVLKPTKKLLANVALWYLWLAQEFVYVGDEAVVEATGKTQRIGIDASLRYQINNWLFLDLDLNYAQPKYLDLPKDENNVPLAPRFTSIGGLTFQHEKTGINGSLRCRYMQDRPANEINTVVAEGYTVVDATLNYTKKDYQVGVTIENLLNTKWREAQFDTESQLKNETAPVSEIHFTPGVPFFLRCKVATFF